MHFRTGRRVFCGIFRGKFPTGKVRSSCSSQKFVGVGRLHFETHLCHSTAWSILYIFTWKTAVLLYPYHLYNQQIYRRYVVLETASSIFVLIFFFEPFNQLRYTLGRRGGSLPMHPSPGSRSKITRQVQLAWGCGAFFRKASHGSYHAGATFSAATVDAQCHQIYKVLKLVSRKRGLG